MFLLLLGTLCKKLSFQWQLSPDLLALPYLNNNKTCILKQFKKGGEETSLLRNQELMMTRV